MNETLPYVDLDTVRIALHLAKEGKISSTALVVALGLAHFADSDTGETNIDGTRIARTVGVNRSTVFSSMAILEEAGLFTTEKARGKSTRYQIPRVDGFPVSVSPSRSNRPQETACPSTGDGVPVPIHISPELSKETPPADREKASATPGTLFGDDTPPTPAKAPRKTKAPTEAAVRILQVYGEKVQPPSIDGGRSRAKQHLIRLLTKHTEADLSASVMNYATSCEAANREPGFRRSSGNFFGKDRDFEGFMPCEYEAPDPDAHLTPEQLEADDRARRLAILAAQDWEDDE